MFFKPNNYIFAPSNYSTEPFKGIVVHVMIHDLLQICTIVSKNQLQFVVLIDMS